MQHHITYYGVDGHGRTVKEAKLDAGRKIERMLDGSYQPTWIEANGEVAILFRTPDGGWQAALKHHDSDGLSCIWGGDGDGSREAKAAMERCVRKHLAECVTDWRGCFAPADVHAVCRDEGDRRDIVSRCQWQRRYHAAIAFGLDHTAAHLAAGFAPGFAMPAGLDLQSVA